MPVVIKLKSKSQQKNYPGVSLSKNLLENSYKKKIYNAASLIKTHFSTNFSGSFPDSVVWGCMFTFGIVRNSRLQMFFEIGVLKNFAIFTEENLCWSLLLIKLQAFRPTQVFSCEYCEIFENSFFYRTPLVLAFKLLQQVF